MDSEALKRIVNGVSWNRRLAVSFSLSCIVSQALIILRFHSTMQVLVAV